MENWDRELLEVSFFKIIKMGKRNRKLLEILKVKKVI
jgi:hypothetical protein